MAASKIISAYYTIDTTDLTPDHINGDLLTHLIVGWAAVDGTTGRCIPSYGTPDQFRQCTETMHKKYPHLKVTLVCGCVGGPFSSMARSPALRANFVQSALALLDECGFDGLDVDWEFPVFQGKKYDRGNFVELLRELRAAFDHHSPRLILTAAVAATKPVAKPAYDIPAIAPLLDFVNLMCYDYNMFKFYNIWASHNAPLFRRPDQKSIFDTLNTVWSADYWVTKGMPREKVIVGIPTYGRVWKLLFSCWHCYNAPCVSAYNPPEINYPQVLDLITNGATRVFDSHSDVPFVHKGRQWVSYEDEQSITNKAEWIRKQDFGGAMIFCINGDDWKGVSSKTGTPFPLISTVHRIITAGRGSPARTASEETTTEIKALL